MCITFIWIRKIERNYVKRDFIFLPGTSTFVSASRSPHALIESKSRPPINVLTFVTIIQIKEVRFYQNIIWRCASTI